MMESGSLPPGWAATTLDKLTQERGRSIDPRRAPGSTFELYSVPSFDEGAPETVAGSEVGSSKQLVASGSVILCKINPRINRSWIVKPKGAHEQIASTEWIVFPPNGAFVADYLRYFLQQQGLRNFLAANVSGVGGSLMRVKPSTLKGYPLPLAPIPEQQRIVEKIETLFAELDKGEEAVREVQKLLARYRQSMLKAAVTGELTADWRAANGPPKETGEELLARVLKQRRESWQGRGRYKEPKEQNGKELPDLPDGWAWVTVDQLLRSDLSNGRSVPDAEEGFPVLRLTALKQGLIDLKERKIGAWDAESASNYLVHQHDVLVSRGNGSKRLVGLGGIVAECPDGIAYPDTMIRIPPLLEFVLPDWFIQIWNSPFMRAQIEAAAKTTAGIYKINQGDIRAFAIPLPPLEEQNAVAALVEEGLSQTKVTENWCKTELKRSTALRQSILKDAFSGNLIPQDPSDEPAEELLERVRTERRQKSKQAQKKALA